VSEISYKDAGVDLGKIKQSHNKIAKALAETFTFRKGKLGEPVTKIGHYAGLVDIGDRYLALHSDGVGTKVLIAQMMNKYDTVGIDCVAMNVNDLICIGAEPAGLIDYIALEKTNPELIDELMKGLIKGAKESGIAIVGGETAIMPDVIKGYREGYGFDLAAASYGFVDKDEVITGSTIKEGDILIGLESSGIHSNGYSLVRKVIFEKAGLTVDDTFPETNKKVGEILLEPTRIYTKIIRKLIHVITVHGIAHITGGAFTKLMRIAPDGLGFEIHLPEPPTVFKVIQKLGNISDKEMYKTFNMGIGMVLVIPEEEKGKLFKVMDNYCIKAYEIGKIIREPTVRVNGIKLV